MNREQYLSLRDKNDHIQLMWEFATDKGYKRDLNSFNIYLMMWSQRIGPEFLNEYLGNVINYYDIKFGVVLIEKIVQVKVTDPFGRVISEEQKTLIKAV